MYKFILIGILIVVGTVGSFFLPKGCATEKIYREETEMLTTEE